jgi:hypothetical protein
LNSFSPYAVLAGPYGDNFITHCHLIIPLTKHHHYHIGPFKDNYFEIEGDEWKKASTDVVIAGLGWISIKGTYTYI